MNKNLLTLFRLNQFLFRKMHFRNGLFMALGLLIAQSSLAQQWNILGNEGQISSVASSYTSIAVLDKVPYVVYVEGSASGGIGKVKRRTATGTWEQVGGNLSATSISYTEIYRDKNDKLYVTYIDNVNSNRLAVLTYNTTTLAWEPLISANPYVSTGSATHSAAISIIRSGLAFDSNNIPYITYSERTATTGYPYLKRFVGGVWETVGEGPVSMDWAGGNNVILDNNNIPYVVYVQQANATSGTGPIKTFRLNTGTNAWEDISPPSPVLPGSAASGATTSVRHTSIAIDSTGNPVVSYFNTTSNNKSTIIRFDKANDTWTWIGAPSGRDANNNSLTNDIGGNVYNIFSDALIGSGRANMVRVFKLSKGSSALTELKNPSLSRGVDSTGENSTVVRPVIIADLAITVGTEPSEPYIVYTKTNSGGIITPIVQRFNHLVFTKPATNIRASSATIEGDVSGISEAVTEKGVVYSTTVTPTASNSKIVDATAGTTITASLSGLSAGTHYYVRAYAVANGTTHYGNEISFSTTLPAANSVVLIDNTTTVTLKNGIVEATITKATGEIKSLIYNGENILSGGYGGGSFYWSWNMPNYQNPANCTYTLTVDPRTNNFTHAEIKLHMDWNGSASTAAMDVDIYYSLKQDVSGLYAAAKLSHPASYPLNPGGEWRMSSYPGSTFDWLSVDDLRNQLMPTAADQAASEAVPGAPAEVTRLTTGVFANKYEDKYAYSANFGDIDTWGWSSTSKKIGVWMTTPSKEYYPGGPMKRELTGHANPVLLNMLGGTHYASGMDGAIAAGEQWEKVYGPFLIYLNKVSAGTENAPAVLWEDAKAQAKQEQAQWPYNWFSEPAYVKATGRGSVSGKLVITDSTQPSASAANMWVGVAVTPASTTSVTDFQLWSKNYQFWVKTGSDGSFNIPNVLPGVYNLYAFGTGAAGQLTKQSFVTVTAGNANAVGDVSWTPTRVAPTVWEIGIPDRSAKEFKHGTDYWVGGTYPSPNWAKFMDYKTEFPNDVTYTIGTSNPATDWNFVQHYNLVTNSQTTAPEWKVKFKLANAPTLGSNSSVYVAVASSYLAPMFVKINGTNITTPTTGVEFPNSSNATIRKGINGAFGDLRFTFPSSLLRAGDNEISFTLRRPGGDIQYDYLRLEAPGTAIATEVPKQEQTITFNPIPGKSVSDADFDVGAKASSGLAVSLSSSNTSVATIVDGKIHIVSAGTTNITASQAGDANWLAATAVSQELVVTAAKQNQTINFNALPAKTVADTDFDAGATASSGLVVSLSSSNASVATIVDGKIHIVSAGTTTITASQGGDESWLAATAVSRELVVAAVQQAQTIIFNALPEKKITDADFSAEASASSGLLVTLTSSNTSVAVIVNGTIQITGVGSTDITASQSGNAIFLEALPVTRTLVVADRFNLPAINFQVQAFDEVCSSGNNGKITITAAQNLVYTASLTVNGASNTYSFNNALEIPSLSAGAYKVCITVDGQPGYSQCFNVTVREPQALSVYSTVNADKSVVLTMAGGEVYVVKLNDKTFQTSAGSVTLSLSEGMNTISVSTDKDCQGTIDKRVFLSDGHRVYPNPFEQNVFVNIGNDSSSSAKVTITDFSGTRKYAALQQVQNGVVQVNLSDLPQGMYIIQVKTGLSDSSSKIIKK